MVARGTGKAAWQGRNGIYLKGPGRTACGLALTLALLWLAPECAPPPEQEKLKKEVETLKAEVAALKEQVGKLDAAQNVITELVKMKTSIPAAPAPPAPAPPGVPGVGTELPGMPSAPAQTAWTPMTLDELFTNKDQLLGTKVTVKGLPGPVMMHKKTLFMSGPGGMVEVIYGNIPDKKQVDRITAQSIETPITVSGLLSAAPGQSKGQVRLIIMADSVEF